MTTTRMIVTSATMVAAAMLTGGVASAVTSQADSSVLPCTADQFTAKLAYGDAGAGNRWAAIELTGKNGERCYLPGKLPVTLVGAHNVLIDNQAPDDAPAVALSDGSSAYVQLHWTGIGAADEQQTPNAITVTAPVASTSHGDPVDPYVTLPWNLGTVDASPQSHTIDVGPLTQGSPS